MQFLIELARTIQSLDDAEFKNACDSPSYLAVGHMDLWKKWQTHVRELRKKPRNMSSYWRRVIREIRCWEEQEIDYMYQRVMELSRQILKSQYFEVQTHSGSGTIPDRTSILNRLVELSNKLLSEIYPLILRLVHYRIDTMEIHTKSVKGNINWNKTILSAVKTSAGAPTFFVCNIPQKTFSTPENLLLHMAVTWVFNDAAHLYSSQKIGDASNDDKKKIWAVLKSSKMILESPLLTEIGKDFSVAKQFTRPTPKIKPALTSVERRLMRSANPQTSYLQLIAWMRRYVDFNVNRYHELANFTFQNTKDFDKMFELWVLFEMAHHIEQMPATRVKPLIEGSNLRGFKFEINDHTFTLHYEKHYEEVPIGDPVNPDYTIEMDDQCCCGNAVNVGLDDDKAPSCKCGNFTPKVVLVMDAKNWRNGKRMEGVQKMVWYMVQMDRYRPKTGILFFSNYGNSDDNEEPRVDYWNSVTVNQEDWTFVNYVVKSSRKPKYVKQLNSVFGQITSKLLLMP